MFLNQNSWLKQFLKLSPLENCPICPNVKSLWNKKMFGLSSSCIRLSLNIAVLRLTFLYQMVFPFAQLGDWRLSWPEKADLSTEKLYGSVVEFKYTFCRYFFCLQKNVYIFLIFSTWFSTKVTLLMCFHGVCYPPWNRHTETAVSFRFTEKLVTDQLVSRALASSVIFLQHRGRGC